MEHAASDALIDRMAAILDHPSHDPHGAPIPTPSGEIEHSEALTLNEVALGLAVQIRSVPDEDPAPPSLSRELGTGCRGLGSRSRKEPPSMDPRRSPSKTRVNAEVIGSDLADGIFVIPVPGS